MPTQAHSNDAAAKPTETPVSDPNAQGAIEKLRADSQKPAPADATKNQGDKGNGASQKPNEWTVVVDLTATKNIANLHEDKETPDVSSLGAAAKYKKLQELAAESANKPVTFVVQMAGHGEPHLQPDGTIVEGDGNANEPATLQRYRIKDGKIEQLPAPKDEGFAKNLANLTKSSIEENPSKKVALMLNADGGGNVGFQGEDGRAQLSDVTGALKEALKGTGHEKLDLVDYDCCLMGQESALKKTSEIANTAVASAETERVNLKEDGQNTFSQLEGLLKNPQISGADFAKQIVEQAKTGSNDAPDAAKGDKTSIFESGTNTLAAFDLTKSSDLSASMDKFGNALNQACLQSPETKKNIQDMIHNMGSYGDDKSPDSDNYQLRDLKLFAQNVLTGIKSGTIKDDSQNDLANSANEVIQNQEKMTIDKRGRDAYNASVPYDKAGDMSAFLPDVGFYDSKQAVENRLNAMADMVNKVMKDPTLKNNPEAWDAKANGVVMMGIGNYRGMFKNGGAQSQDSQDFTKELSDYRQAKTHEEKVKALGDIQTTISNLQKQPEFDGALSKESDRIASKHNQYWQMESANEENGWNRFVETLRQQST